MSKKDKSYYSDIIVVGAGATGSVLALLLANSGFQVTLIEKGSFDLKLPKKIQDGYTTALMNGSINMLKRISVWEEVAPFCEPMKVLRIAQKKQDELEFFDFKASELGKTMFGFNLPQIPLRALLLKKIKKHKNINLLTNSDVQKIDYKQNEVIVSLEGEMITASLIIGADGWHSVCREQAGIKTEEKIYDQSALTFAVKHSKSHENISTEIHKPGGPLTFVPMPNDHSAVIWVNKTSDNQALQKLNAKELQQKLQQESNDILGDLDVITPIFERPLKTMKAKKMMSSRLALVGEAAHILSPVGAQGLNMSLRDVHVLVELICEYVRLGQDIGGYVMLNKYAQNRKKDLLSRYYGVHTLNTFIASESGLYQKMRYAGLKAISSLPPLKHFLMREGMSPKTKRDY